MYEITISGTPIAKARPRATIRKGHVHVYTPTKNKDFEYKIRQRAEKIFEKPIKKPVKLNVRFLMPRPKRIIWKTKPMPRVPCDKRPDIDNLLKSIIDSLNGVAFNDDGQISFITVSKKYHSGDEGPETTIRIGVDES